MRVAEMHMTPSHNEFVTSVPIRLVLAEGHEIVLLGLERFLSSIEDFAVVDHRERRPRVAGGSACP